jgi:hypothetical protein
MQDMRPQAPGDQSGTSSRLELAQLTAQLDRKSGQLDRDSDQAPFVGGSPGQYVEFMKATRSSI